MIEFLTYLLASLIGGLFTLLMATILVKRWMKSSPKAKKALFVYFDLNEYHNMVRDSFLKIAEQKNKIQKTLVNAIGNDEKEVLAAFNDSYKELDNVMNEYLKSQAEMEKKLFGDNGVSQ